MESMFNSRRSNKTARTGTRRSITGTSLYQATPFGTPPPGARQVMQKSVDTLPGSHLWVQPNGGSADPLRQGFGSSTCSGSSSWVLWRDSSDPGSLYPKYRRGRLCSALLAIAVVLVVLTVLAIAGLAVYMGALRIDSNNPELVFDGSLRVTEGDIFVPAMDNNASLIFREKAIRYQNMIDRVYQHSQLRPAYKRSSIGRFENGTVVVFFRIHLDRRKIPRSFLNVEETARDILIQELVSARLGAFTGVKIDPTSINIKRSLEDDHAPEVSSRKQMFPPELTNNHIDEETTSTTTKTPPGLMKAIAKVEDPTDQEDIPVIEGALVESVPESPSSNHLEHSSTTTVSPITTKTTKKPGSVVQGSVVVTKLLEPTSTIFRTGSGVKKTSSGVQTSQGNIEVDINQNKEKATTNSNGKHPVAAEEAVTEGIKPSTKKPISVTSATPGADTFTRFWATDGIRKSTGIDVITLTTSPSLYYPTGRDDLEAVDTIGFALGEENLLKKVGSVHSESVPHQHIKNSGQEEVHSMWNGSQTWTFSPPKLETDEPWRPIIPPTDQRYLDKADDDEDIGSPGVAEVVVLPPAGVLQDSYSSRIGQPAPPSGVEASGPDDKVSRVSLRVAGDDASPGAEDTSLLHATSGGGIIVRKHQPNATSKPSHIVDPFAVPDQLPILHQFRDVDAILLPTTHSNTPSQGTVSPSVYHTSTNYHQTYQQPSLQNQSSFSNNKKPTQDAAYVFNNQPLRNKNQQRISTTSPQTILKNMSSLLQSNQFVPIGGSSQLKPKPAGDQAIQHKNRSSTENIYRKPVQSDVTSSQNRPTSSWQNGQPANSDFLQSNVLSKKPHSSPPNYKQAVPERQHFSSAAEQVHFGTAEPLDSEGLGPLSPSVSVQHSESIPTRYGGRPGWNEGYRVQDYKPSVTTSYSKSSVSDSTAHTTPFPVYTLIPVRSNSGVGRPLRPRPRPPQSTRYNDTSMSVVLNSQYHLRNGSQNKGSSSLVKSPLGDVIVGVNNNARPMAPTVVSPAFTEISASTDLQAHRYQHNSPVQVNRRITVRPPPSSHKSTTVDSVATPATWTRISPTSESVIEFDFPPSRSGNITEIRNNHDSLLMLTKKLPPTSKPTRNAAPLSAVVVPLKHDHSPPSESAVGTPHDYRNRHDIDPVPKPVNINNMDTQSLRSNNAISAGSTTTNTISSSTTTSTQVYVTPVTSTISTTAGTEPNKLLSSLNTSQHSISENKHDQKPAMQVTTEVPTTQVHSEDRGKPLLSINSTSLTREEVKVSSTTKEPTVSVATNAEPSINTSFENPTTHVPLNLTTSGSTETTVSKSAVTEKNIVTSPQITTSIVLTRTTFTTEKDIVTSPKVTTSTVFTTTTSTTEKNIVTSPKITASTTIPITTSKSSDVEAKQQKTTLNSSSTTITNATSKTSPNISVAFQKVNTSSKNESQNQLSLKTMKRKVSNNPATTKSNTTVKQEIDKHNSEQENLTQNSSLSAPPDKKTDATTTATTSTLHNTVTNVSKSIISTTAFPTILNTDVVTSTNVRISFGENGEFNMAQRGSSKLPTVQVQTPVNDVLNESTTNTISTSSHSESTTTPLTTTSSLQTTVSSVTAKNSTSHKPKESHRQPKMKPDDSYSALMGRSDFSAKHKSKTDETETTVATTLEQDILSTVLDSIFEESQNFIITTEDNREEVDFITQTTEMTDTTLNTITPSSNDQKHNLSDNLEVVDNLNSSSVATNIFQDESNSTIDGDFTLPHLQISHLENETSSQFTNYTISTVSGTSHGESLLAPVLAADIFETDDDDDDGAGEEYDISDYDILHLLYYRNQTKQPKRNVTAMSQEAVNALSKYAKVHTNPPPTTGTITPIEDDTKEGVTTEGSPLSSWIMEMHAAGAEEAKPFNQQHNSNHAAIPMLTKIYNKVPPTNPVTSTAELSEQGNSVNGTGCPGNLTLKCGDGECISSLSRCNQLVDCNDGADERGCTCADYLRAQFLTRKLCDGVVDCWDFSDENNCEWCSPGQFVCPNSQVCVDQQRLCDGARDCPYGDDEKQCVTVAQSESTAGDLPYSSEGFLMVRKQGRWGKLCLQNFDNVVARSESSWEVADLGRAVCKAMTYSDYESVNRTVDASGSSRADDSHYYELAYSHNSTPIATAAQARSSLMFQETQCSQKEVVKVSCKDLECGVRPQAVNQWARYRTSRIVGGGNAAPGSWPWQAALYKEGEFQCGATLIADRWLVSAGHCFYHALDDYWVARLGALRRGSSFPSPYEQLRPVSHIILHPGYVDAGFLNDISLLRLREPVQFSDFVRPVCLPPAPPAASIRDGRLCTVVGWGQLFEVGRIFPDTLQEVQLPIISTAECRKRTLFLPLYRVTDNMFCAGFDRGGRDACLGDSGGPLMCQEKDGRWSLYGVTSNGYGCARANRPGVYTKVANYVPWLQAAMAQQVTSLRDSKTQCKGHRCPLGECLPQTRVCNGFMECSDGSDEKGCW